MGRIAATFPPLPMAVLAIALIAHLAAPSARAQLDEPFMPRPSRIVAGTNTSQARLYPSEFPVATVGDYSLLITIGQEGIAAGGGLLVDFPKAWFSNPVPLIKPLQQKDPDAPHYLEVRVYRDDTTADVAVDHRNFDGSIERFRHVVRLTLHGTPLRESDTIRVSLKNTTSPIVSGTDAVRVAVDAEGDGRYVLTHAPAEYHVRPGPATSALVVAPSDVQVGNAVTVRVSLFDAQYNLAESFDGALRLEGLGAAPIDIAMGPGRAVATVTWAPERDGFYWPGLRGDLQADGGPVRVHAGAPALKVYWGDLHSHSTVSKDGIGTGEYRYARDVTHLDFYASTEHGIDDGYVEGEPFGDSISPAEWKANVADVKAYYDPGRFVTLLAYECSLPNGHHNVFYRGLEGVPWPAHRVKTVERLWTLVEEGEAITIPHHLGIQWGSNNQPIDGPGLQPVRTATRFGGGPRLDWTRPNNPRLRPSLEIYSAHGQSEYFNRDDALAYEQVRYTAGRSSEGPHYARDAWTAGLPLGVVAASDDHEAHPGLPHLGLTAVFAPELTRDAVFDALLHRASYGTTGQRILLDFRVAGVPMGQEVTAHGDVEGSVLVAAPSAIRYVEVLANREGSADWPVVQRWETPGRLLDTSFSIRVNGPTTVYLRAELMETVNGRVVRAWSSPIWLRP